MAKTKPRGRDRKSKKNGKTTANGTPKKSKASPETLLAQSAALLQTSQAEQALILARQALSQLQEISNSSSSLLPALNLIGEIDVELGDIDAARESFLAATKIDVDGTAEEGFGGPEKFLWLAQLCEEGGAESVSWFERGISVLRREIAQLEEQGRKSEVQEALEEKKAKLANALCGIAEVYMTDLSWEEDAEARCEAAVTEALLATPNNPEPLQTLASIRISQVRFEDARAALTRSLDLWQDLEPDDAKIPDFSTRISLSRLLMEAEMEEQAIEVLERLITENDESVEAWYLGGWCLHLLSEKPPKELEQDAVKRSLMKASRDWLQNCLKLYSVQGYEDERLKEHAEEILKGLDAVLGPATNEDDEEEEWEDAEDASEDEEMEGT